MNICNFIQALAIQESPHHSSWMKEGVDYPREKQLVPELTEVVTVQNILENGLELLRLQEEFLGLDLEDNEDEDDTMDNGALSDKLPSCVRENWSPNCNRLVLKKKFLKNIFKRVYISYHQLHEW